MKTVRLFLWLICSYTGMVQAQVGGIDPNFTPGDGFGPSMFTGLCRVVLQQPDGKLLVGGGFEVYDGDTSIFLARLNPNGTRDNSFTPQINKSWSGSVATIALQPDGKILVGGTFETVAGQPRQNLARLHANGTLDTSFSIASGFNFGVTAVAVLPDGKILVGGGFTIFDPNWNGTQTPVNGFVRLQANGALDTTFNISGAFSQVPGFNRASAKFIALQPDGKILAAGQIGSSGPQGNRLYIARFNANGSLDPSFDAGNHPANTRDQFNATLIQFKLLPNGKIMLGGTYVGGVSGLDRLNSDGSLDTTFVVSPGLNDHRCWALAAQGDGKVLAARVNFGPPSEAMILERYLPNGQLDTAFPTRFFGNDVNDILVQQDGNIVLVGNFSYNPRGIMRLIGDYSTVDVHEHAAKHVPVKVYPQPAQDFVQIEWPAEQFESGLQLQIRSIDGRLWHEQALEQSNTIVTLHGLPDGLYFYEITKGTMRLHHGKLLKQ